LFKKGNNIINEEERKTWQRQTQGKREEMNLRHTMDEMKEN